MKSLLEEYNELKNKKYLGLWLNNMKRGCGITVTDLAKILSVSRQQVYRYIDNIDILSFEKYMIVKCYVEKNIIN